MLKIGLAGSPNVGKTSLFNMLTGKTEKVGNWHGVTVKEKGEKVKIGEKEVEIYDLPGLYTLKGSEGEQKTANKFLTSKKLDLIILMLETRKIPQSIDLIKEIKSLKVPTVIFCNFYKEFVKAGGKINCENFQSLIGERVIFGDVFDKNSVDKIRQILLDFTNGKLLSSSLNCDFKIQDLLKFFSPPRVNRASKIFFSKGTAIPIFALIMLSVFWFCFGKFSPITLLSGAISRLLGENAVEIAHRLFSRFSSPFVVGLICHGIIGGAFSVLSFLPQICALSLCMDVLDQSGYISRFSAVVDDFLSKFGLSGRATYSLASGFGCTAVALNTVDGIDDRGVKLRACLSLPFISCSAKTPVYIYLAKGLFGDNCFFVISGVYFLSVVLSLINSLMLKKSVIKRPPPNYISEIANMRIPAIKPLLKSLQKTAIGFIIKIGTVILLTSAFVWILKSTSIDFEFLEENQIERSVLAFLGKKISFVFYPIGLTDWRFSVAMLSGVFAKEGIASTLAVLFPNGIFISFSQKLALIVFCYAYTPCVTALAVLSKKVGVKWTVFCAIYQLIAGLLLSYLTFWLFKAV